MLKEWLQRWKFAGIFSILADGTIDISCTKEFSVYVRMLHFKITWRFFKICPVASLIGDLY